MALAPSSRRRQYLESKERWTRMYFQNGAYEGEVTVDKAGFKTQTNEQWNGVGTYVETDGARYEGLWKDGSRHGQGLQFWTGGDIYAGQWQKDAPHGKGRMFYASGSF